LHGFAGGWLTPADGERLADAGHEVWRDPLQFAVRHMDVVIRRNLPAIMTFEQTSSMLADWRAGADADLARLVTALVPGIPDQVRLHRLLRALAADRVPVSDAAAILAALSGTGWPDASLEVLTRTVRRALRPSLPGNEPGTRHVVLPASLLAELAENGAPGGELRRSAGTLRSVLQLRELLSSTRTGAGVALVVPDEATRRAVRRLAVLDFPDLAVISRDELVDAGSGVAADLASSGGQR
jgi:flagellar biosynthesis component FlhA